MSRDKNLQNLMTALIALGALGLSACSEVNALEEAAPVEAAVQRDVYISSRPEDFPAFLALPQDEPIEMLNLIRFKDVAEYEAGSGFEDKDWSGADAYYEYARRSQMVIDRMDAEIVYSGRPALTMIGPKGETWDAMFVLRYENVTVFGELLRDPEYRKHAFHRKAGVADSRLVRMAPAPNVMPQPE